MKNLTEKAYWKINKSEFFVEVMPLRQFKIIIFDDFIKSTEKIYNEVINFLEIPADNKTDFPRINENKMVINRALIRIARHHGMSPLRRFVFVKAAPFIKKKIGIERFGFTDYINEKFSRKVKRELLSEVFNAELKSAFRDDVRLLGELLQRDLNHWILL